MGRFPQPKGTKGSLKWTQLLINKCPELINNRLRDLGRVSHISEITWLSPIEKDDFAEYRNGAFLELLGIDLTKRPLATFWPSRGPQWDALGRAETGEIFLVESKAHIKELLSTGSQASRKSMILIERSLKEVQSFLRINPTADWSKVFYQYANRISHLYLLRELNNLPAFLVFQYFLGDREMAGPSTVKEWKSALELVNGVLGLRDSHKLSEYILEVFIDVQKIENATVI